jgi:hypothetical protein
MARSSPICPQGVVVEIKRKIVEGKEGIANITRLSRGYIMER